MNQTDLVMTNGLVHDAVLERLQAVNPSSARYSDASPLEHELAK